MRLPLAGGDPGCSDRAGYASEIRPSVTGSGYSQGLTLTLAFYSHMVWFWFFGVFFYIDFRER